MKKINHFLSHKTCCAALKQILVTPYVMLLAGILLFSVLPSKLLAQAPVISYATPQVYNAGTTITPLAPTATKVGPPNYNNAKNIGAGLSIGIALDALDNIYFTVGDSNIYVILNGVNSDGSVLKNTGLAYAGPLARDVAGNMYAADTSLLVEVPAGGGAPFIKGHFVNIQGLATDAAGNVFVADKGNNAVYKIPANGGSPEVVTSVPAPNCVAVDSLGNVFVGVSGNNTLIKLPAGGGPPVTIYNGGVTNMAVDGTGNILLTISFDLYEIHANGKFGRISDFNIAEVMPNGVAVDQADNVFIAGSQSNAVKEFIPAGGYYISQALPAGLIFSDTTGVISGTPIAPGPAKTYTVTAYRGQQPGTAKLTISVTGGGSANTKLAGLNINKGTLAPSFSPDSTLYAVNVSDTTELMAITPTASDTNSTIKVNGVLVRSGNAINIPLPVGTDEITVLVTAPGGASESYIVNVTRPKVPLTVTANNITAGQGAPLPPLTISYSGFIDGDTPANLSTQPSTKTSATPLSAPGNYTINVNGGVSNKYSFKYVKGTLHLIAETLSYAGPDTYGIGKAITPLAPQSFGVAPVTDTVYQVRPYLGGAPFGLAAYTDGNVYVTDGQWLYQATPNTDNANFFGSGFRALKGIAIDHNGIVYVSDKNEIKKVPVTGGTPALIGTKGSYNDPEGIAVDAAGNVYVADAGNNRVVKIPVGNGAPVSVGSGFSSPSAVALDAAGDIYVADQGNNAIKMIPAGGGPTVTVGSGFNQPSGVALDAAGNVYVADQGNAVIKMIPSGTGAPVIIATGFSKPNQLTVDQAGTIYVSDTAVSFIIVVRLNGGYYIGPALPAGLSLNANSGIISGTPTAASPATVYTITGFNLVGSSSATVNIQVLPELTVTADSTTSVHGTALPALTLTYSGFTGGDTPASLTTQPTASTTAAPASPKGNYPITVSGGVSSKYAFNYVPGALTMISKEKADTPIPVQTYGNADLSVFGPAFHGITYTSSNAAAATIVNGKIHLTGAGASTIVATIGSGAYSKTLTVNPALLTITADNKQKKEGVNNAKLTVTYTGFVNGEANAVLNTQPIVKTTATKTSPSGTYPITVSGAAAANYSITYVNGIYVVKGAAGSSIELPDNLATEPLVNPAISPNGDGINDVLTIKNIENYPNNKLTLLDRNGNTIYTASNYDNVKRVFDGHSSITGKLQNAGTYFYVLQYKDSTGVLKSKTGYLVLRY